VDSTAHTNVSRALSGHVNVSARRFVAASGQNANRAASGRGGIAGCNEDFSSSVQQSVGTVRIAGLDLDKSTSGSCCTWQSGPGMACSEADIATRHKVSTRRIASMLSVSGKELEVAPVGLPWLTVEVRGIRIFPSRSNRDAYTATFSFKRVPGCHLNLAGMPVQGPPS